MKKLFQKTLLALVIIGLAGVSSADEASVKKTLLEKYKSLSTTTPVRKTEITGLYEINLQGKAAYTNESVDYLLVGGSVINANTLQDITAKRQTEFLKDFFASLPLENAYKRVYGKGERKLVTFEDPDCPFCQKQARIFEANAKQLNATVYTFLFPIPGLHPDGLRKANFIACSDKPEEVLKQWMVEQKGLPVTAGPRGPILDAKAKTECAANKKVKAATDLARSLSYTSTPRFIFENGWGAKGWLDMAQLEEGFAMVAMTPSNKKAGTK